MYVYTNGSILISKDFCKYNFLLGVDIFNSKHWLRVRSIFFEGKSVIKFKSKFSKIGNI